MDYGRLAYLKALDLEGRLGIRRDNYFGVWYADRSNIKSGKTLIAQIEGKGDIAVFINSSTKADFYVDEKKMASGQNVFFAFSGGNIYSQSSTAIEKLSIIAFGNISSSVKLGIICADLTDEYISYVENNGQTANAYLYYIGTGSVTNMSIDGYIFGDVCALNGDYIYVYATSDGRVDILSMSGKRRSLELGASAVAVSGCEDGIYVAYIKKGTIYYFVLKNFEDKPSPIKLMYNGTVDEIRLTKRGSGLCFSSGGKCYFKELGASDKLSDKIYVTISKEVV